MCSQLCLLDSIQGTSSRPFRLNTVSVMQHLCIRTFLRIVGSKDLKPFSINDKLLQNGDLGLNDNLTMWSRI